MKPLTFVGFLKQYVRELSGEGTLNIFHLAKDAEHANPRLREPLVLYALFNDKVNVLLRAVKGKWLEKSIVKRSPSDMLTLLELNSDTLPENYRKVYRSYRSVVSRKKTDDYTKELMLNRIRRLQEENNISNYRLYSSLNLNPGNVNAFLKHGDTGKVSLGTARKIFEFAKKKSA